MTRKMLDDTLKGDQKLAPGRIVEAEEEIF